MKMMIILSVLIGAAGFWLYSQAKTTKTITWFGWLLFAACAISSLLALDVFFGSIIEHEMQAGWMGLGLFGFSAVVCGLLGWRLGVYEKVAEE